MIALQEISGYLPYKLKVLRPDNKTILDVYGIQGELIIHLENDKLTYSGLSGCKPILRLLSDLTKEIEINGEKFIPVDKLQELFDGDYTGCFLTTEPIDFNDGGTCTDDPQYWPYCVVQKLLEWHFWIGDQDRFGKDIIDLNTLK